MGGAIGPRLVRAYRKVRWRMIGSGPGRARILTVPTENGTLSFSTRDVHNARALYVQREWEMDLITRSVEYLRRHGHMGKPGANILIDVGANIGMICIAMLRRDYFREAVAVEPDADNFGLLTRNIEQNGLQGRIRACRCALTDRSGEVELEIAAENLGDHRVRAARSLGPALMKEEERATVRVSARTLDDLLAELSIHPARVGLIWVDIQGFEGYLFRGARSTLAEGAPLLSEFWPYGIRRSGMDRDEFASTVTSLFARIVIVDAATGRFEERESAAISGLFDAHPRPEEQLEILYLRR